MHLRITLTIEVPAGLFEQADTIAKLQEPLAQFSSSVQAMGVKFDMEHELIEAPKPRAPRADKGTKRITKIVPAAPASQSLSEAAE